MILNDDGVGFVEISRIYLRYRMTLLLKQCDLIEFSQGAAGAHSCVQSIPRNSLGVTHIHKLKVFTGQILAIYYLQHPVPLIQLGEKSHIAQVAVLSDESVFPSY